MPFACECCSDISERLQKSSAKLRHSICSWTFVPTIQQISAAYVHFSLQNVQLKSGPQHSTPGKRFSILPQGHQIVLGSQYMSITYQSDIPKHLSMGNRINVRIVILLEHATSTRRRAVFTWQWNSSRWRTVAACEPVPLQRVPEEKIISVRQTPGISDREKLVAFHWPSSDLATSNQKLVLGGDEKKDLPRNNLRLTQNVTRSPLENWKQVTLHVC